MQKENLNKENLWNELMEKFPKGMKIFCDWIDKYKADNNWNKLFNSDSEYQNAEGKNAPAPKFHDLPMAMQRGIIVQFLEETDYEDCFKDSGGLTDDEWKELITNYISIADNQ